MAAEITLTAVAGAAVSFLLWFLQALLKETHQLKPGGKRRIEPPLVVVLSKAPSHTESAAKAARIQRGA